MDGGGGCRDSVNSDCAAASSDSSEEELGGGRRGTVGGIVAWIWWMRQDTLGEQLYWMQERTRFPTFPTCVIRTSMRSANDWSNSSVWTLSRGRARWEEICMLTTMDPSRPVGSLLHATPAFWFICTCPSFRIVPA